MRTLEVIPKPTRISDGKLVAEAECVLDGQTQDIWFRVDEAHQGCVNEGHEHFLLATLFYGMEQADTIHIYGSISPHLLASLEEFNAIWHAWRPEKYRVVEISADDLRVSTDAGEGGVFAFSGGVDACVTLHRHAKALVNHRRIPPKRAVFVHGFDIPIENEAAASVAYEKASRICRRYSIEPLIVSTNIRTLRNSWEDVFGSYVSAILHFIKKDCAAGVFASGVPYTEPLFPWGSNPICDPFLGGTDFPIRTDGAELGRLDKVRMLVESNLFLSDIRVCWEGETSGRNCGKCEKCIRTMLEILACNAKDLSAFDNELTPKTISSIRPRNEAQLSSLREVLEALPIAQRKPWWAKELDTIVRTGVQAKRRPFSSRVKESIRRRLRHFSTKG